MRPCLLRQAFDKHDAHQVVQLVLHANRQQAVRLQRELRLFRSKPDLDAFGAGYGVVNARHGQAALS